MKRNIVIGQIVAALMLASSPVIAADYGDVSNNTYTDVEFGSGWYLRGDITYNMKGREDKGRGVISSATSTSNLQYDYDDALGFRVGAGYYMAPNFRLEGTIEAVLQSSFAGEAYAGFGGTRSSTTETIVFNNTGLITSSSNAALIGSNAPLIGGKEETTASYNAGLYMVTGYYDLPKIGKFTPYIGAGGGLSQINYKETSVWTCSPSSTAETCGDPAGTAGAEATKTTTRDESFVTTAWQLSAGTAIELTENMSFDVGYTFTQVGGASNLSYADGTAIDDDGFAIHRVNAGIRYQLW